MFLFTALSSSELGKLLFVKFLLSTRFLKYFKAVFTNVSSFFWCKDCVIGPWAYGSRGAPIVGEGKAQLARVPNLTN